MPFFDHDGLSFHFLDKGAGLPFVFQHGLGGDVSQPFGLYDSPAGIRLVGFDCRAHGQTRPLGDLKSIEIATFADDLVALLDHLAIDRAVVGGVSMGAAVAVSAALRHAGRVVGMVLSRPAWLDRPHPENARVFSHVAQFLLKFGPVEGLERYKATPEYRTFLANAPDTAWSLEGQFTQAGAEERVIRLERIPHDSPCHDRAELKAVCVPTLVLGSHGDPVHPWSFVAETAQAIPGSEVVELTPKSVDLARHVEQTQRAIDDFLTRRF